MKLRDSFENEITFLQLSKINIIGNEITFQYRIDNYIYNYSSPIILYYKNSNFTNLSGFQKLVAMVIFGNYSTVCKCGPTFNYIVVVLKLQYLRFQIMILSYLSFSSADKFLKLSVDISVSQFFNVNSLFYSCFRAHSTIQKSGQSSCKN